MTTDFMTAVAAIAVLSTASVRNSRSDGKTFEVSIELFQGNCLVGQGDLLYAPKEFEEIAIREFDTSHRVVIHRRQDLPKACVAQAIQAIKNAGFHKIRLTPTRAGQAGESR